MGIIIIFRKSSNRNLFREYLHRLISLDGEKLIISSGFIAEGKFSLLNPNNMLPHLNAAVGRGLSKIIFIAGKFNTYFGRGYRTKFDDLIDKLVVLFGSRIIKISQDRWHAKISIRILKGEPIAAIVGSSNLTTTAYGIGMGKNWNKECDVIIWDNSHKEIWKKFSEIYKEGEDTIYFEDIKGNFDERRRLNDLYDEIKEGVGEEYKKLI